MIEKIRKNKLITLLVIIGAVYFFLKYLTSVFSPILIAMLFVTMFGPMLKNIQDKFRIHRQIGAIVILVIICIVIALLVWVLFSWIVGSLPSLVGKLDSLEQQIGEIIRNGCEILGRTIGIDNEYLQGILLNWIENGIDYFQNKAVPGVLSQSWGYVKGIASFGGWLVTFMIATIFLAKDYDKYMNNILDREEFHVFLEVVCGIIRYIATFVKAQLIIMTSIAVTSAVVLSLTGIKHGALWGILAGILDALPFIGTGIVLLPLALTQLFYGYYGKAAICLLLFCGCVLIREVMEPRLIGKKVGIPAIAVLLSMYAGIQLFGLWGIIKGPLGFMIIYQTYLSMQKRNDFPVDGKPKVDYD